ncbi:MAG: complex I subunit 4 family protein [Planctomycetota bacterium]|jgi:NADH-quinone oxidoreductase subunit M
MHIALLIAVFLPLVGALALPKDRDVARWSALVTTLLTLGLTVVLLVVLLIVDRGQGDEFAKPPDSWPSWIGPPLNVRFCLALDGLSMWLFALTALLMVTAVLVSWEAIKEQATRYYRLLLILETGMLGVFVARDIILFYVFFEFTLIPLFFLIGVWGSEQRRYAAIKFFLFTLAGSVLTFLGLLAIVLWDYYHPIGDPNTWKMTFSIPELAMHLNTRSIEAGMPLSVQIWIFLALFAGFAIKVPLFPLHTWLPLAHVEAPTAGSVILAGVLLKIGTYGFVRFCLPMLPDATVTLMPYLLWLSVAGIIYGALVALAQKDIKRLIAYSSVSHLGFCMLGIFAVNRLGMQGGVLQMINHGLSTGGLFALVGMLYERYHTRKIADLGGLARKMPVLTFFMLVMTLSSIGLPGLNGFAGEFLLLVGMFQRAWVEWTVHGAVHYWVIAVLAVSGVVLGAWYMLYLVQRVFFGPVREPEHDPHEPPVRDLNFREVMALAPLVVFIVWIGVQPRFFLKPMSPTLNQVTNRVAARAKKMEKAEEKEERALEASAPVSGDPVSGASASWTEGRSDGVTGRRRDGVTKGNDEHTTPSPPHPLIPAGPESDARRLAAAGTAATPPFGGPISKGN